jgi:tetratricopeptide (TPR) repeat protein
MTHWIGKATALTLLGLCISASGWSQQQQQQQQPAKGKSQPTLDQQKPGEGQGGAAAPAGPTVSKEEEAAYKVVYDARNADQKHLIDVGEAFLVKYPMSVYVGAVYASLTSAYLATGQEDKFLVAGNKTLEINPDNVDVLPLMAMAIPRRVNSKTTDAPQQLQKALTFGRHGVELLNSMPKPADIDDVTFQKVKNDKLAMCHSGIGVADFQMGKYPDSITELSQSVQLASVPDPVDYYLLGKANEATNHFTDAIAAYNKCAATGPLQPQCKAGLDQTKKDSQNQLEAPK